MSSNNDVDNDEMVSQFMAFTNCADPARATSYLEMSGGNVETAVSLYMEHEQGGGVSEPSAAAGPGAQGRGAAAASAAASGGGAMMGGDFGDVRAPDATRTMRLMDDHGPHGGMMHHDPAFHLMSSMMEEHEQLSSTFSSRPATRRVDARAAVNDAAAAAEANAADDEGDDDDSYEVIDVDEEDDNNRASMAPARLEDMFAPPNHLLHKATFQGARSDAKDAKRWLLVNIQRDSEFSTHVLNRDVWRDELVENLIREGFIFWQQMDMHPEARTYIERYQVHDYPHVGIIDPRTGRLVWRREGWTQEKPMTAEVFAEHAMDFCSRNSFDRPPVAPRPGSSSVSSARPAKRPMHEMTEDEQLQAAMRASMEDVCVESSDEKMRSDGDNNNDDNDDEIVRVDSGDDDNANDGAKPIAEEEEEEKKPPTLIDSLLAVELGEEPANGARVQLRMPDVGRVVRKFGLNDSVRTVYAYVAQNNEEARGGREFLLMAGFPPKDLIDNIGSTIGECKLGGDTVTVRWK